MNIVSTILGERSGRIKWDATWNLLAWLFDPRETHGLGDGVLKELAHQTMVGACAECTLRTEVNLGIGDDGKTKWPDLALFFPSEAEPVEVIVMDDVDVRRPRSSRKLANLLAYGQIAQLKYPSAIVKIVAITNAIEEAQIATVRGALQGYFGAGNGVIPGTIAWHLVSLQVIGSWAATALRESVPDPKVEVLIADFIAWSGALVTTDEPTPSCS